MWDKTEIQRKESYKLGLEREILSEQNSREKNQFPFPFATLKTSITSTKQQIRHPHLGVQFNKINKTDAGILCFGSTVWKLKYLTQKFT